MKKIISIFIIIFVFAISIYGVSIIDPNIREPLFYGSLVGLGIVLLILLLAWAIINLTKQ